LQSVKKFLGPTHLSIELETNLRDQIPLSLCLDLQTLLRDDGVVQLVEALRHMTEGSELDIP
jgi:hypothetical protein